MDRNDPFVFLVYLRLFLHFQATIACSFCLTLNILVHLYSGPGNCEDRGEVAEGDGFSQQWRESPAGGMPHNVVTHMDPFVTLET